MNYKQLRFTTGHSIKPVVFIVLHAKTAAIVKRFNYPHLQKHANLTPIIDCRNHNRMRLHITRKVPINA